MGKKWKRLNGVGHSSGNRFVQLHFWMLRSSSWENLSLPARCLLIEMMARFNGSNNGWISFSHREAAKALKIGKNTPTKLFRELEELGFIKARQRGSFDWKKRHATTWELTMVPIDDREPTKEFMRPAGDEIQNPVPPGGTDSPSQRDRGQQSRGSNGAHSPSTGDRQPGFDPHDGPSTRDTSNIPGGVPFS